ncbi:MAG: FUSC family protein [Gammaproteobacteria bacterium]
MARPAAEAVHERRTFLEALLQPTRERVEMAFRLALICALTTLATEYYGTPEPALTAYLVFFLNRPERTTSLIFNVALLVLITIVIALVLLLAIVVVDEPAWRVAAMTLCSIALLFLASASKLRPVGPILALIVAYALDVLGLVPLAELATRGLLYAWLFVAIPAGVSVAVNLLIAPAPRRMAERGLAARLRAAAAVLIERDEAGMRAFTHYRDVGVGEVLERLHLAHVEHTLPEEVGIRLRAAAHSTTAILFLVDAIRVDSSVPADWRAAVAATLREMATAFEKKGYPVQIEPPPVEARTGVSASDAALMHELGELLTQFTETVSDVGEPAGKAGFFLPDAFTNPEHLRYALKTTAAAMFCYFLYVLLDWPGIHTCLITCYIVALGTTAETVEKLSLRIIGCLVGAAAGIAAIVWVIPAIDSIWALLAVVFVGTLCGGWVAAGSSRIAYAGFQFVFAFFLCVIQGTGPAFDLTIARDRVIGILIGNAVMYLVFTRLWPVSVSHRIEQAFDSLLKELRAVARMPPPARRLRAPALQGHITAIGDDLALVPYEPRTIRPSSEWSSARHDALEAAAGLTGLILLDREPHLRERLDARLETLTQLEKSLARP